MKKILFIINPISGKKNYKKKISLITDFFYKNKFILEFKKSKYKGHIEKIVKTKNILNYFCIVIMGGDGSVHEVINGILNRTDNKKIPLGIIPNGSGNSLCRDLNLLNSIDAAKAIANNKTINIDVAKIWTNNEIIYNFNIIGWGMVSSIGYKAEKFRWLGPSRYTLISLIEIFIKKTFKSRLTIYDKNNIKYNISDNFMFGVICNTIHTGKGMKMAPKAKLDDGILDLLLIKNISRFKLLKLMPKLFSGTHIYDNNVKYYRIKKLKLETEVSNILNIDGEIKGVSPFQMEVLPKAIEIFK